MTVPILALEDAYAHLPIRAGNTEYDDRLTLLILTASTQIEHAIDRELDRKERTQLFKVPTTSNQTFDFSNTSNETGLRTTVRSVRFTLNTIDVDPNSVTVYYDPSGAFAADTEIDSKHWSLNAEMGLLTVRYPMVESMDALKVVHTGGYAEGGDPLTLTDSVPADIKLAAVSQLVFLFTRSFVDNVGKADDTRQGSNGGQRFAVLGGLVPEASALVSRYRAFGVGIY